MSTTTFSHLRASNTCTHATPLDHLIAPSLHPQTTPSWPLRGWLLARHGALRTAAARLMTCIYAAAATLCGDPSVAPAIDACLWHLPHWRMHWQGCVCGGGGGVVHAAACLQAPQYPGQVTAVLTLLLRYASCFCWGCCHMVFWLPFWHCPFCHLMGRALVFCWQSPDGVHTGVAGLTEHPCGAIHHQGQRAPCLPLPCCCYTTCLPLPVMACHG